MSANSTLWVMSGIVASSALTFVPAIHGGGRRPSERSLALQKLYDAFDESGDDEDEQSEEDSEDHGPRRSKRARQGVDKLGAKCGRVAISATPRRRNVASK